MACFRFFYRKVLRGPMPLPIVCLITLVLGGQLETTFSVEYAGKKYDFRITEQDLKSAPTWPAAQENPPLSARRAIEAASKQLAILVPNGKDWRLSGVSLKPIDTHWIYLVEFLEPLRAGASDQVSQAFQVVVLMNGVAVVPRR
jgi:hypothetical protein